MFSEEQKAWIVRNYAVHGSPTKLKRHFCRQFGISGRRTTTITPKSFVNVIKHFDKARDLKRTPRRKRESTESEGGLWRTILDEIGRNPSSTVRKLASDLNVSKSKVQRHLKELKLKPFKYHRSQVLSESHKKQRMEFCSWILDNDIASNRIIFTDEKWFYRILPFNRQNVRYWSIENPHVYDASVKQGAEKVMAWAGIVNGRVLPIVWFPNNVSVNSENYLKLLQDVMWPSVEEEADSEGYYYQQDGAPPHCARTCLDFLSEKFPDRVISRRTETPWPACSPDLSPLDFWFWGDMEDKIRQKNPQSLQEIKDIVDQEAADMDASRVVRACQNFRRRVEICHQKKGGHFESEIKKFKSLTPPM